ncbi:MAG TPA: hypothetical protein VGE08_09225 [Steroidobacter sp.]|uniref:hypothetical protein n=1 Tax=Steroidobacter sp. TaxID=1978227 RepID=UPI002EDB45CD
MVERLQVTYPSANAAVSTLLDLDILRPQGQQRRNRAFHAHEVMNLLYTGIDAVLDDVATKSGRSRLQKKRALSCFRVRHSAGRDPNHLSRRRAPVALAVTSHALTDELPARPNALQRQRNPSAHQAHRFGVGCAKNHHCTFAVAREKQLNQLDAMGLETPAARIFEGCKIGGCHGDRNNELADDFGKPLVAGPCHRLS